jgi:hypothetical protein
LVAGFARGRDLGAFSSLRVGSDALGVVEIEQHGGTVRGGFEQVFKLAQRERANHVALVTGEVIGSRLVFAQIDVEVIHPEVGHYFLQLRR